ncbi:MAG: hypothetical protein AAB491_00705 [Patescibacteria group bacterium]
MTIKFIVVKDEKDKIEVDLTEKVNTVSIEEAIKKTIQEPLFIHWAKGNFWL